MSANDGPTRIEMLQMLLLAGGSKQSENEAIVGKTRLQKQLFLAHQVLTKIGVLSRSYSFKPYHYGPYCKDVYQDIEWLKRKELIEETRLESSYTGIVCIYSLTPKGITQTKDLIARMNLEKAFVLVQEIKEKYNSMNVVDLVEFTHKQYPEYVGNKQ